MLPVEIRTLHDDLGGRNRLDFETVEAVGLAVQGSQKCFAPEACVTAKLTANKADDCGRSRTATELEGLTSNSDGLPWTLRDIEPAVFKTVCGALLRRPG